LKVKKKIYIFFFKNILKCKNKLSFEPYNRGLIQSCITGSYPVGVRKRTGVEPDPSIAISGAYNDVGATIFPNAKNIVLKQLSSSTFH